MFNVLRNFRKKWHLFPPHQSDALHQTRVPYEESSVFSPINVAKPDLTLHPRFADATPYVVTLDPGDVLFVPHHWWHFVETVETSVSVNTWIEMVSFYIVAYLSIYLSVRWTEFYYNNLQATGP